MAIEKAAGPFNYGDTVTFGPFPKGLNNVDRSLTMGDDELVNAVNLDINRDGILTERVGYTQVLAETDTHSLWARDGSTALYASGSALKMIRRDDAGALTAATLQASILQARNPVYYVGVNGTTYYSNGLVTGVVRSDNTPHAWGVETPARNPVLSQGSGGFAAGWYLVGVQYVNDLGETGGIPSPAAIQVTANASIIVSGLPVAADPDIQHVRVYLSEQNGDILYHYADYAIGTTTVTLAPAAQPGRVADDYLCAVMPPLTLLEHYNGRIFGAAGSTVWYSNALRYGLYLQRSNFIMVERPVALVKAVEDGVYIGTDEAVMFYAGPGPSKFSVQVATPFGAIPGTGVSFPKVEGDPLTVGWMSERGFIKAHAGGKIESGDKERAMVGMFSSGASMYREQNGIRQVVSTMRGETRSALTSTDYAEAEVRRNGVII